MPVRVNSPANLFLTLRRMIVLAIVGWTAVSAGSLAYHALDARRQVERIAHEAARHSIEKDLLYRYWASSHGGVYVPATGKTQPNPYLSFLKERDITTPSGRRLTLMNPAYMTRQVHELGRDFTEVQGHVTSLHPLRPENAPDPWEAEALRGIAGGAKEIGAIAEYLGAPHYRLLYPLYVEQPCLQCHEAQGYKLGDLRGGISASIPMAVFAPIAEAHLWSEARHFGGIWLLGIVGLSLAFPYVRHRIEEREQALRLVEESERRQRAIVENAPFGAHLYRLENDRLVFTGANAAADRILGVANDQFIGKTVEEAFPALNGTHVPEAYRQVAESGRPVELEQVDYRDGRMQGAFEVHAVQTARRQIAVFFRDITERSRAELALRESEERFRSLFDNAPDAIFLADPDSGVILDANRSAETLLQRPKSEIIGMHQAQLHPRPPGTGADEGAAGGAPVWTTETTQAECVRKDGAQVPVSISAQLVTIGGNRVVMGVYRDLTERKRAQEHHRTLEQQLLQSQKLESIGRLAGGIAHDINYMLTPILGYADLLAVEIPGGDPLQESVREITNAAERVRDMTRQLLAFARKQTLDMRRLDVNAVITGFGRMLRRTLREDILINLNLEPSIGAVLADGRQLEQVILNLAVNAQDAMPTGGVLMISTKDVFLDEPYVETRPGLLPGRYLLIRVADTGMGMGSDTRSRLFEPFFTTKESGQGTGLGLATVYGIVKQHKGYIDVASEPRQGTTFSLYLPITDEGAERAAGAEREGLQRGSETILVVEDQAEVREIVRKMLITLGYRVLTADSGKTARAALDGEQRPADLLLADVIMPGMNGRELYEELRRIYPTLKVLYMSGYPADVISKQGALVDGVHFIRKPFSVQEVSARVRDALDGD